MTYQIHIATTEDIRDLAFIHLESKKAAERDIVPDDFLDGLTHQEYIEKWEEWFVVFTQELGAQTYIAKNEEGKAVGFCNFGNLRTPPPGTSKIRPLYSSEIYAIYVLPEFFGHNIGTALFKKTIEHLLENKHQSLCLWALEKNKRACGFYAAMQGQRIGKQFVEMGGRKVKEVCYGWRSIKGLAS